MKRDQSAIWAEFVSALLDTNDQFDVGDNGVAGNECSPILSPAHCLKVRETRKSLTRQDLHLSNTNSECLGCLTFCSGQVEGFGPVKGAEVIGLHSAR